MCTKLEGSWTCWLPIWPKSNVGLTFGYYLHYKILYLAQNVNVVLGQNNGKSQIIFVIDHEKREGKCALYNCEAKVGYCHYDSECNAYHCDFVGGDCYLSVKLCKYCNNSLNSWSCAGVFKNRVCDKSSNNESCIYEPLTVRQTYILQWRAIDYNSFKILFWLFLCLNWEFKVMKVGFRKWH